MRTTVGMEITPPRQLSYEPLDPLSPDTSQDAPVMMTDRQLGRLLLVATEVGARFQREGIDYDPLAWMYAPRRLFGGLAPIEAVTNHDDCERAILLHALGIGLDADPILLDSLRTDDDVVTRSERVAAVLESAVN
jgi:hypothetical protein